MEKKGQYDYLGDASNLVPGQQPYYQQPDRPQSWLPYLGAAGVGLLGYGALRHGARSLKNMMGKGGPAAAAKGATQAAKTTAQQAAPQAAQAAKTMAPQAAQAAPQAAQTATNWTFPQEMKLRGR